MRRQLAIPVVEMSRRMCRGGVAELEAPPPRERTRLEAASPWKGPVLPWGGETSCFAASDAGGLSSRSIGRSGSEGVL